ncbi:MAG: PspA/IM30 family protein [Pirellulaceae bacterium]|nr:PspA/IM30 family protein [Pirellulaceae bacterium]
MKWLNQFTLVMRSNLTTLRESVENPERLLHQLVIDMEQELDSVRSSVAEAVADEIQMRKRAARERDEAESWMQRATTAMKRGDEAIAKSALQQKLSAATRADRLTAEHAKQQAEVAKLQDAVRDLEDKIRQAKQKRTLLTARLSRANSTQKIHTALDRTHSDSAIAQFNRLEDKVDRQEALTEAWERMDGKDPDARELERQFEAAEREQRLQTELELLKTRIEPS